MYNFTGSSEEALQVIRAIGERDRLIEDLRKTAKMALDALENARIEYDYHGQPMDKCDADVIAAADALRAVLSN
jgi:hypothetical protein